MVIHESLLKAASFGLELELFTRSMSRRNVRVESAQSKIRATDIARKASQLGITKFRAWWVPKRLTVTLPLRLYVEAVLFSMGVPWSELVSGFKPLRVPLGSWR